jgi:hypothetical protein
MGDWLLAKASVRGTSHINSGSLCQDASIVRTDHSGRWLIAVASDGAGSAKRADEGADFVTNKFADALAELSKKPELQKPGSWINDFVIGVILEIRSYLRDQAGDENIQDFNCTLVACLLGPSGGFSIHIGDGAIFGQRQDLLSTHKAGPDNVSYSSPPENGEYANETYFLTEGDWIRHLRITPMPALKWVLLCTDGGAALSMRDETEPKTGFLSPVLSQLIDAKNNHRRDSLLETILNDPKADGVTGDDKTLVIAIRANVPTETILADLAEPELEETPEDDVIAPVVVDNNRTTNIGLRPTPDHISGKIPAGLVSLIRGPYKKTAILFGIIITIVFILWLLNPLGPPESTVEDTASVTDGTPTDGTPTQDGTSTDGTPIKDGTSSKTEEQKEPPTKEEAKGEPPAEEANGSNAMAGDTK